ncbi:flavin reductase family protein [Candidatus Bipolaricaulota bacterium]
MKRTFDGNLLSPLSVVLVGALVNEKPNYLVIGYICPFNFAKHVFFSIYKKRYTHEGILEHRTFSVNIPSADMIKKLEIAGSKSGREYDKSTLFESFYGELKTAPMIAECPITIECEVDQLLDYDQNHGVIGRAVKSYVNEELLKDEKTVDMAKADLLVWTTGDDFSYYRLGDRIEDQEK